MGEPVLDKPLAPGIDCRIPHIPARGTLTVEGASKPSPTYMREETSPFTGQSLVVAYYGLVWVELTPNEWTAILDLPILATWDKSDG